MVWIVTGLTDRNFFLIAVIGYGLSTIYSVFLWRKGFREDDRTNYALLALSCAAHTTAMVSRGFSLSRCPVNNLFEAMMFIMWTIVASYLVAGIWPKFRFMGAFAAPALFAMGVFGLMPGLDQHDQNRDFARHGLTSLHAALILLAYGAFGLSGVASAMYLTEEHDLKFRKARAIFSLLPSIERLDVIASRLLIAGLVLLTTGLLISPFLMKEKFGVFFAHDPKIFWSILVWLIYAGLLVMRKWFSPGGRRFAWGSVGSFSFVLLTFWGVNLLSGAHAP
jgi:ABC-type transport system involved in cytochrome c biogenesis permease subunit